MVDGPSRAVMAVASSPPRLQAKVRRLRSRVLSIVSTSSPAGLNPTDSLGLISLMPSTLWSIPDVLHPNRRPNEATKR
jgi:hypothetical protein